MSYMLCSAGARLRGGVFSGYREVHETLGLRKDQHLGFSELLIFIWVSGS